MFAVDCYGHGKSTYDASKYYLDKNGKSLIWFVGNIIGGKRQTTEFPTLYDKLTGRQNLDFFASLYAGKTRNLNALLSCVELQNDANKRVSEYSKGMKSRLGFIRALIHDPDILFLDEPTSRLDPANARLMKNVILEEKAKGKTIILTTHNIQDAQELCDRVAFMSAVGSWHWTLRILLSYKKEWEVSATHG